MLDNYKELYPINCEDAWESSIKSADSQDTKFKMLDDVYYFSNDWVSNSLEYWSSSIPTENTNMNILFIGVYEGRLNVFLHNHIFNNNKCTYYCIDNFGYFENQYYERNNIDLRYNCIAVKERFIHNTRKFKDNVHLIEGNFNLSTVPKGIIFDMILLDSNPYTLLQDVINCISFIRTGCILYITYEINISEMSKLKKILPNSCKLSAHFYKDKSTFDRICIKFCG